MNSSASQRTQKISSSWSNGKDTQWMKTLGNLFNICHMQQTFFAIISLHNSFQSNGFKILIFHRRAIFRLSVKYLIIECFSILTMIWISFSVVFLTVAQDAFFGFWMVGRRMGTWALSPCFEYSHRITFGSNYFFCPCWNPIVRTSDWFPANHWGQWFQRPPGGCYVHDSDIMT